MGGRTAHRWKFFRAGGVDQVVLESGADVAHLPELDQKLWVALACPTRGTELDEKTLALIDTDNDGRVRVPEVLAAVRWLDGVLKSLDLLFEPGDTLPLPAVNGKSKDGKLVLSSAKRILSDRGKKDQKELTLADVAEMEAAFVATRFNGDGVVPADTAESETTRTAIEQMIAAVGSVPDRSGKPGLDRPHLDSFLEQAAAVIAWDDEGQAAEIRPLGEATDAAAAALAAVAVKLDDYFARCRIAAYDGRAAVALAAAESELLALSARSLSREDEELAKLPLAKIESGRALPLGAGLNPAWADRIAELARAAITPLLGARTSLTEAEYATLVEKLGPYRAWRAKAPSGPVAELGAARLRELAATEVKDEIEALLAEDASLEEEYTQLTAVEKAVRLRRDLLPLLRNFVNFADFYARRKAVFQTGTLYLDGRACDLAIPVNDPARHAALAGLSRAYLAYCDCTRGAEKRTIVVAFTAGDVDNLMVGRNGVFYDRQGRDWDARIINLVENPISVRQAFWSPYKRLVRMVEEQVAKRAAEKEKASTEKVDGAAARTVAAGQTPTTPGAAPGPKKLDVGIVAAVGVAVAGLATFLSSALGMFLGLGLWMPLGLLALILVVSLPSMLVAWLKLRQRNLGPLLDASGWAINGRVRVNVPFGGSLTTVAQLPAGATRTVDDPYGDRPVRWWLWVLVLLVVGAGLAWTTGVLDSYLPESAQAERLLPRPAAKEPAPAPSAPAAP